ncbi:hypothetical protein NDU88_003351 [Pleurodeles waltl]|uniref:Uncharacterized protein n=1 Tax=Pleurodeles waltl TaxID=8319 RepID=A0AAV7NGF4_PLEWA|nr:hypothetical protein NDU88_003351 [Pleurodeles waltl]
MRKADHKQDKPSFESKRKAGQLQEGENQLPPIKAMFMDLKQILAGRNAKLDHLTDRMDHLKDRVDDHDICLDQVESRTSDLEVGRCAEDEHLLRMEHVLELILNKNEALEACSRRNNVCILGVPESKEMGRMEDYVENMLTALFPGELSPVLVVQRVHRSIGPKPPPGNPTRPIIAPLLNYRD